MANEPNKKGHGCELQYKAFFKSVRKDLANAGIQHVEHDCNSLTIQNKGVNGRALSKSSKILHKGGSLDFVLPFVSNDAVCLHFRSPSSR